jgi:hypothetical protein
MNDYGRMLLRVHRAQREDDWQHADRWRRLHARPDAPPLPAVDEGPRRRLAIILRLIARHA